MPSAKEIYLKYMAFENSETDYQSISMFGYTAKEIIEALEFWGNAKDEKDHQMQVDFTREDAVKKCHGMAYPQVFVQAIEALGLIKFKEPVKEAKPNAEPIFELRYPSGAHTYKIWANGHIEGFSEGLVVINRIPQLLARTEENFPPPVSLASRLSDPILDKLFDSKYLDKEGLSEQLLKHGYTIVSVRQVVNRPPPL